MESSNHVSDGVEEELGTSDTPPPLTEAVASHEVNQESELESFRERWKQELEVGTKKAFTQQHDGGGHNWNRSSSRPTTTTPVTPQTPPHTTTGAPTTTAATNATSLHISRRTPSSTKIVSSVAPPVMTIPAGVVDCCKASKVEMRNANVSESGGDVNCNKSNPSESSAQQLEEKEREARRLYVRGVELERAGELYEAIQQYRRAMQLVPDIESKAITSDDGDEAGSSDEEDDVDEGYSIGGVGNDDDGGSVSLYDRLSMLLPPTSSVCQSLHHQHSVHIGSLPREIIEQILHWVVGGDLDMRSLHAVAKVCRGFYVLTRVETLWKKACIRVWGPKCSLSPCDELASTKNQESYNSWRRMYITRPQPRYNGCYISKTSYFRSGECNFHDSNYQPWHLVSYYRLLRFFPAGVVLMLTTSEAPQTTVSHLTNRDPKHSQVLVGRYTLQGSLVHLVFHRQSNTKRAITNNHHRRGRRRGQGTTDVEKTMLEMSLELASGRRRRRGGGGGGGGGGGTSNWFLWWRHYTITSYLCSGAAKATDVDVSQVDTFPQMAFSRVKSYARDSTESL